MTRDALIAALRAHEPELKAAGVVRLSLFGSAARHSWDTGGTHPAIIGLDIPV
jgi:predicted nucleotidyltransferase